MPVGEERDEGARPSIGVDDGASASTAPRSEGAEELPRGGSLQRVRRPALQADEESEGPSKREQRRRYEELLQELRLVLPGVQVLAGFLFTVPFSSGFARVDDLSRIVFGIAMVAATSAATVFMTPAAFHRVGDRHDRAGRIRSGVRLLVLGLVCMAVALCSAMFVVLRMIFGTLAASLISAALAAAMVALWAALPRSRMGARRARRRLHPQARPGDEGGAPARTRRCRRDGYIRAIRRGRS